MNMNTNDTYNFNDEQQSLIIDNLKLIYFVLNKIGISQKSQDYDDYYQSGCFGLIKAAKTYNNEKDIKFSSYAVKCIKNEILMYNRKLYGREDSYQKKFIENKVYLYDKIDENGEYIDIISSNENINDEILSLNDTNNIIDKFNQLDFKHKNMYCDWLNGMSTVELSKKYKSPQPTISRRIKRISSNLRRILL